MKPEDLRRIVEDDDLGLLNVKPATASAMTADARLVASFKEIEDFVRKNGREPRANHADMHEFRLNSRLIAIRGSKAKSESLAAIDAQKLLASAGSAEEIDDDMGLLDVADEGSIFDLRHVPASIQMPEKIAQRRPCKDFAAYEPLFAKCHEELLAGEREIRPFTGEQQIQAGHFFVLHGVTVYVASVGEKEVKNKKVNARLHCVFENGTESDMLLRSLATELYKDPAGRRILDSHEKALEDLAYIKPEDAATGFVYILQSASESANIASLQNLYKIGFSTVPIEQRIKNAKREPTYLMAPVKVVSVYQCFNLKAQRFEGLLHAFFGKHCLDIQIGDGSGRLHTPREWFIAPLASIELAVQLLINGEIVNYRYDGSMQEVVER